MPKPIDSRDVGVLGSFEEREHKCDDDCSFPCECGNDYCKYDEPLYLDLEKSKIRVCQTCYIEDKNKPPGDEL